MKEAKKLDQSILFMTVTRWVKTNLYGSLTCELTKLMYFNTEAESVQ